MQRKIIGLYAFVLLGMAFSASIGGIGTLVEVHRMPFWRLKFK